MKEKAKISILFLIGGFDIGGKERQLIELIHNVPKDKFEVHLFSKSYDAFYLKKIKSDLTTFHSLDRAHFHLSDIVNISNLISEIKPDVVYSWARTTSHFCLLIKLFAKHKYNLINGSIRNAPIKLPLSLKAERLLYPLYKTVVSNSYAGLNAYGQLGKNGRFVLYNGFDFIRVPNIDKKHAKIKLKFPENKFVVVMVANLTELKDHETFLLSMKECINHDSNFMFYIVGNGNRRQLLEKYAKKLRLGESLEFLGHQKDVELIFKASDLSVLTSTSWYGEGISNSIIESLACGTPVIATDSNGTKEIIVDGENGFLIRSGDYKSLSKKIIVLKSNMDCLEQFSGNGVSLIERKFSIETMINNFIKIIEATYTFSV